jgi:K+-transporting ATPase KdpF subunit
MTVEHWIGAFVSIALCAYLVHALVRAERIG